MKTITKLFIALALLCSFTLASADVVHVWRCQLNDGKTTDDLDAASKAWLAAVKAVEGTEAVEAYHNFPVAANAGDGQFLFITIDSDFSSWGAQADAYPGSAVAEADEAWAKVATCSSSSLWFSQKIE